MWCELISDIVQRICSRCYFVINIVTTKFIVQEGHFSRAGMSVTLQEALPPNSPDGKKRPFRTRMPLSANASIEVTERSRSSSSHTTDATELMEAQIMPLPAEFISFPAFSTKAPLISGRWDIFWSKPVRIYHGVCLNCEVVFQFAKLSGDEATPSVV